MQMRRRPVTIVVADDDPDDRMLIVDAFKELRLHNPIMEVIDGQDLMDYLLHEGKYSNQNGLPLPGLVLLDLNMPKMDGREALKLIKNHPELHRIPVVVLTTSKAEEDILRSYDTGANSFIIKPVTMAAFVDTIRGLHHYWFQLVEVPVEE